MDRRSAGGAGAHAVVAGGVGRGRHGADTGVFQHRPVLQGQGAASVGVFGDAGDAAASLPVLGQERVRVLFVRLGGLGLGLGAVFHNLVHGGGAQLLHKLAGELGPVGPDHLVDGGAHAVGPLLDHLLLPLGHVGVGHTLGGEGDVFRHVVIIGQVRGDVQVHAAFGHLHAHHLQGAGGHVEPGEDGGDALLVGLDGDGGALVADGDGGVLL